jgi:hypothetical protein
LAEDLAAVLGVNKNTVLRALHILRVEVAQSDVILESDRDAGDGIGDLALDELESSSRAPRIYGRSRFMSLTLCGNPAGSLHFLS